MLSKPQWFDIELAETMSLLLRKISRTECKRNSHGRGTNWRKWHLEKLDQEIEKMTKFDHEVHGVDNR